MRFLGYLENKGGDEKDDPNAPKYLWRIIGLLAAMAFGAYQIITFNAQDEMCAHLAREEKKAMRGSSTLLPLSDIREMQQRDGCN